MEDISGDNQYDVCVIGGLGHVGLPLAISLAKENQKVIAYDIDQESIRLVSQGEMPFLERDAKETLQEVLGKTFFISSDKSVVRRSHFLIIIIGTPVDEHLNPRFNLFLNFFNGILDEIRDGHHIILRSTVFPGTTEKIKNHIESLGKKVRLSFCPERIAQGYAMAELRSLPQIVASFDEESQREAAELFQLLSPEVVFLTPVEAELGKLFTNVWRYVQFAISNQFYQIALQNNLDFYKIFEAIRYNYPRTKSIPGAGFAAGPCLFKDTMQLAAYSNNTFFLGHSAMLVNEGLPNFIVQRLKEKHSLKDMTVGILGMAFKADNDDKRESLSYKLKKILEIEAGAVLCSDVYINDEGFVTPGELIEKSHIVILATPHKEYAGLAVPEDRVLVDIWNFYKQGGFF